jgi:tetratricopeptide (TPR) repeat protein
LLVGDAAGALVEFDRLVELAPDDVSFVCGRGRALARVGLAQEALAAFTRAHEVAPDDAAALEGLVLLRATSSDGRVRDGAAALALLDAVGDPERRAQPTFARCHAAALAEVGRFAEAAVEAERALGRVPVRGAEALRKALESERELYRASRPLRDAFP